MESYDSDSVSILTIPVSMGQITMVPVSYDPLQMSTKRDVGEWIKKGEFSLVRNTDTKSPCWTLLHLIHIPTSRNDCQLVLNHKRLVVGFALCFECNVILATKVVKNGKLVNSGTTPLNQHVERCTKNEVSKLSDSGLNFKKLNVKISKEDRIMVKESQSALVAGGIVGLNFCDKEVFRNFSQVMLQIGSKYKNPDVSRVLFGKTAVRSNIIVKLVRCKSIIAEAVRNSEPSSSFSVVTDMTTDQVTQRAWTDLTFIWVENYEIKRGQYACRHWEGGRHTSENIRAFLYEEFSDIGIIDIPKVPIVTDSGRNILAAVSDMSSHRCSAHRLHTVLSDAWEYAKANSIEIRNLDIFSRNLVTFAKASNNIQEHLPVRLKHGGKTRPWRSLYQMFHSISVSYEALELILRKKGELVRLQSISKPLLEEVLGLLEQMCPLWDKLEVGDKPSLQNSIVVGNILKRKFSQNSQTVQAGLNKFKDKFISGLINKYFTALTSRHFLAVLLDITLRDFLFIENDIERQTTLDQAKTDLELAASDYACIHAESLNSFYSARQNTPLSADGGSPTPKRQCTEDPFAEFRTHKIPSHVTQPTQYDPVKISTEEITRYLTMTCPHIKTNFNPLKWWGENCEVLPVLAGVSRAIYCIPSTSSESERHFSKHKSVLTARRATLAASSIESLVVVSSNMASGII